MCMCGAAGGADIRCAWPPRPIWSRCCRRSWSNSEQATGIHAEATYQASAMLTTQIQNGAPFDLFLSADLGYPQRLIDAGLADAAGAGDPPAPITYAKGTLVLWTRKDSHLAAAFARSAAQPGAEAAGDCQSRPRALRASRRGRAHSLKLYDALKPRLVTAENIAQAAQFVDSGNADAGLISLTSALTPRLASSGTYFVIPRDLYPPIEQGAVIVSKTSSARRPRTSCSTTCSPPPVQASLPRAASPRFTRT